MAIIIQRSSSIYEQSILFTISSGVSSCDYATFEWYLNDELVCTENSYLLLTPALGDNVYVKVKQYSTANPYWHNGHFYGNTFNGNFNGGTFHYGKLNGCVRTKSNEKPKPFIKNM